MEQATVVDGKYLITLILWKITAWKICNKFLFLSSTERKKKQFNYFGTT